MFGLAHVNRFCHIVKNLAGHGSVDRLQSSIRRHHHHWQLGPFLPDLRQDVQSVGIAEANVEEHHVRILAQALLQALRAAAAGQHIVAALFEIAPKRKANRRFIVDDLQCAFTCCISHESAHSKSVVRL